MKKVKSILIGMIIGLMLSFVPIYAQTINSINIKLNAINVQLEGEPVDVNSILYEGSTYLPMRKIAELVGKDVEWEAETMTANIIEKKFRGDLISNDIIIIIDGVEHYNRHAVNQALEQLSIGSHLKYSLWAKKEDADIFSLVFSSFEGTRGNIETRLIEDVPYVRHKGAMHIKKDYYEQIILPLVKQGW